nr:MAG TPA: hypothetical protein [Caudoviricetes sp.]
MLPKDLYYNQIFYRQSYNNLYTTVQVLNIDLVHNIPEVQIPNILYIYSKRFVNADYSVYLL